MSTEGTPDRIEDLLRERLPAEHVEVDDETEHHRKHPGFRPGAGNYTVRVVADAFRGRGSLERHRLVYDALRELMPERIHALSIQALSPEEWNRR